jgi:predicted TIM-barrel fold metal-dependent hydrolase
MKYYDAHLHLPSPDAAGVQKFFAHITMESKLVGGTLILNNVNEYEIAQQHVHKIPHHITTAFPFHLIASHHQFFTVPSWFKVHPRLHSLKASDIDTCIASFQLLAMPPAGIIVDCFPWGPVLEHNIHLPLVITLAQAFPQTPIIAAHAGGYESWAFRAHTMMLANVWYEFSFSAHFYLGSDLLKPLETYLSCVPSRVLFGSDWPNRTPAPQLEAYLSAARAVGMSTKHLEELLIANAQRLWPLERSTASHDARITNCQ